MVDRELSLEEYKVVDAIEQKRGEPLPEPMLAFVLRQARCLDRIER